MNKIISFSLWGNSKLYCQGALDNIECAKEYYPDWKCRFYVAQNCPAIPYLQKENCEVIIMPVDAYSIDRTNKEWHKQTDSINMLWRFFAIADKDVDIIIFRDTDSRLNDKESQAVQEWEQSNYLGHMIHECKEHYNGLCMGGMWGIKTLRGNLIPNIVEDIKHYINIYPIIRNEPLIFIDLWFIVDYIRPILQHSWTGHGYGHEKQLPSSKYKGLIGEVVHEEWREEIFQ